MQSLQYRLVFKDGKVQLEMVNCTGPVCDANAEKVRQFLNLAKARVVAEKFKPEYIACPLGTMVSAEAETSTDVSIG